MSEADFNPYQSPQVPEVGQSHTAPLPEDPQSLVELQARIAELERRLEVSHLFGPLWKRCLTVFIYFFLAYAVIGLIAGAIIAPVCLLLNYLGYLD